MSRLIDADALLLALDKRKTYELADGRNRAYGKGVRDVMKDVDKQPTIDAVPVKHGHWIDKFGGEYRCSSCRKIVCIDDEVEFSNGISYDYCPWCGARMNEVMELEEAHNGE